MRVLLIEDDSATAQSIELMLKSEGFNVYTTDLGEEGVDLGKIYDYDLILLDLNLPDMSGMDVLRQLRSARIGTPVVVLSGILAGIRRDKARSRTTAVNGAITRTEDEATTYRVGALYTLPGGVAPYVSYAESFLPVAGTNLAGQPFDPQMGKQWEAGVKWQPNPNLLATAAVYEIRDTNRLTISPTNPLDRVQTGEVKTTGFEVEVQATVATDYTVTANYAYVDAKVSKSNLPVELGKPLASVPMHVASAWLVRQFKLADGSALRFGGGVRYVGESEDRNLANPPLTITTPSNTLVDLMGSYERDNWRLSINVNNLLDKYYYSACLTRGDCFIGARRTAVAQLAYRF